MGAQFNIAEAEAKLSELIELARKGEEVVIVRAGEPVARIVPAGLSLEERRKAGWMRHWKLPEGDDWWKPDPQDAIDAESRDEDEYYKGFEPKP